MSVIYQLSQSDIILFCSLCCKLLINVTLCSVVFIVDYERGSSYQKVAHFRSSRSHIFFEIGVLKNFAKLTGKRPATLLKETLTQVFSCEYCEIFKNSFLYNTSSGCVFVIFENTFP